MPKTHRRGSSYLSIIISYFNFKNRCWMSIFNPLMWVFFAPAVFLFLVCNMFVSQSTGNKRCWLVLQVFSIFCRSLVLSFWEYGEQSRVYQDKASNNIITTQDSGITNQPFPQTDKALFCSNWAWSRNPISVSATWLPWNAAICSTFWKDYKNLHDVELCIYIIIYQFKT